MAQTGAFAIIGPSLWNQLLPSTRSTLLTDEPSDPFRSFKTSLLFRGLPHWKRFWLVCTARSAIQMYRSTIQYNTIQRTHLEKVKVSNTPNQSITVTKSPSQTYKITADTPKLWGCLGGPSFNIPFKWICSCHRSLKMHKIRPKSMGKPEILPNCYGLRPCHKAKPQKFFVETSLQNTFLFSGWFERHAVDCRD